MPRRAAGPRFKGGVNDPEERMKLTRSDYPEMPRRHGALMGLVQGLLMFADGVRRLLPE